MACREASQKVNGVDARTDVQCARRAPLLALLAVSAVSTTGNYLTFVAIPWFVLQTTGSAARTGLTGAAMALAVVLAGVFGGPLIDRLGFKRCSVVADVASGLTLALIPLLYMTTGLAFWQLVGLVFLSSLLDSPGATARESLIPDLARGARMGVERAYAINQAIQRSAMLIGPLLAGVLIATLGVSVVLMLDAATFALSAIAILVAVPRAAPVRSRTSYEAEGGYIADLAGGLEFIWRDRPIRSIILIAVVANFILDPLTSIVSVVYSDAVHGSALGLGFMLAGFGSGALTGTLVFGLVGHLLDRRTLLLTCFSAIAPPLWALGATPSLPVTVAAFFLIGLGVGPINPLLYTVLQERAPPEMRGRVLGAFTALAMAAIPAGTLLAGYALEAAGLLVTTIGIAACYSVLILSLFSNAALKKLDVPAVAQLAGPAEHHANPEPVSGKPT